MRYFLDTEFIECGASHPLELISIGIVAEDGREYFAVNKEFNPRHANNWVKENVLPHLPDRKVDAYDSPRRRMAALAWQPRSDIAKDIFLFIGKNAPEFWTYYGAYDYVILSQLFGGITGWPPGWPMLAYDLRQWLDTNELLDVRQPEDAAHDALKDARWIAETLKQYEPMQFVGMVGVE